MFAPGSNPSKPSSKDKCETKQTPVPCISKLGPVKLPGNPLIKPFSSVTTHWLLVPEAPASVISSAPILSAMPSFTQKRNGPPSICPPATLQSLPSSILSIIHVPRDASPAPKIGPSVISKIPSLGLVFRFGDSNVTPESEPESYGLNATLVLSVHSPSL